MLTGKIALVTGASRGIGEAIARKLAENGATVIFTYHSSAEKANVLAESLRSLGATVRAVQSDAANFEAATALIEGIIAEFGRIDIIVNNAGITKDNMLLRMTEEQFDSVISTNLKSVFNVCKAAMPALLKQKSGSVINITSIVGITGNKSQANYAASKAGIIGFLPAIEQQLMAL